MKRAGVIAGLIAGAMVLWGMTVNGSLSVVGTLTAGLVDFSGSTGTAPNKTGTALPATCTVGQTYFKTDAAAGRNVYACTAANTWTLEGDGSGTSLDLARMMWAPWGLQGSTSSTPLAGSKRVFTVTVSNPVTAKYGFAAFRVATAASLNCSGGSGPCGFVFSIWSNDLATNYCQTETAYGGNSVSYKNLNTTGGKWLGFVSGANVSGGVCTLPAGSYNFVWGSDSTGMTLTGLASSTSLTDVLDAAGHGAGAYQYIGVSASSVLTGDGSTLAPPASLSGAVTGYINTATYTPLPVLVLGR